MINSDHPIDLNIQNLNRLIILIDESIKDTLALILRNLKAVDISSVTDERYEITKKIVLDNEALVS